MNAHKWARIQYRATLIGGGLALTVVLVRACGG